MDGSGGRGEKFVTERRLWRLLGGEGGGRRRKVEGEGERKVFVETEMRWDEMLHGG